MKETLAYWFKVTLVIVPWATVGTLVKIHYRSGNPGLWIIPALVSVWILVSHIPEVQRELDRKR